MRKFIYLLVFLISTSAVFAQVQRPFYTTAELYKTNEETGVYEFYRFENQIGAIKYIITDSTLERRISDKFGKTMAKSMMFNIVKKTRVDEVIKEVYLTRVTYTLEYSNKTYYFEFFEGHLDEIMWQTPSGIMRLIQGDLEIVFKDSGQ
jgi:hypothetical protein